MLAEASIISSYSYSIRLLLQVILPARGVFQSGSRICVPTKADEELWGGGGGKEPWPGRPATAVFKGPEGPKEDEESRPQKGPKGEDEESRPQKGPKGKDEEDSRGVMGFVLSTQHFGAFVSLLLLSFHSFCFRFTPFAFVGPYQVTMPRPVGK
jgi:hypothetical protein